MTGFLRAAYVHHWVGCLALGTGVVLAEGIGGARIPVRTQWRILGSECTVANIVSDCNDSYWCASVDVGDPPDPTKCPGSSLRCNLACTATTGTYQDNSHPGDGTFTRATGYWQCGKKYVTTPNCAYYASGTSCKCSTSGTASSLDCQWYKFTYSNCSGGS